MRWRYLGSTFYIFSPLDVYSLSLYQFDAFVWVLNVEGLVRVLLNCCDFVILWLFVVVFWGKEVLMSDGILGIYV